MRSICSFSSLRTIFYCSISLTICHFFALTPHNNQLHSVSSHESYVPVYNSTPPAKHRIRIISKLQCVCVCLRNTLPYGIWNMNVGAGELGSYVQMRWANVGEVENVNRFKLDIKCKIVIEARLTFPLGHSDSCHTVGLLMAVEHFGQSCLAALAQYIMMFVHRKSSTTKIYSFYFPDECRSMTGMGQQMGWG